MILQLTDHVFALILNDLFGDHFLAGVYLTTARQVAILDKALLADEDLTSFAIEVQTLRPVLRTISFVVCSELLFFCVGVEALDDAVIDWECFLD